MSQAYLSIPVESITLGEGIPICIYVFIQGRFILFREEGSVFTPAVLQRFQKKKVAFIFVKEQERQQLLDWIETTHDAVNVPHANVPVFELREKTIEQLTNAFEMPDSLNDETLKTFSKQSTQIVDSILKKPLSQLPLSELHRHSKNVLEHSLNVAFLSVYCASQMGYNHKTVLENIALGSLLHDLGQSKVKIKETDLDGDVEHKMREHPELSMEALNDAGLEVPFEVQLIITQHHEYNDGTGFPKGMKGSMIYDLSRIVAIINFYDQLVRSTPGPWGLRQKRALTQLTEEYSQQFDPQKLERITKILGDGLNMVPAGTSAPPPDDAT